MAQRVRAPDCSCKGLEFKSQQPHGGSQPSARRSDSLLNKYILERKRERERERERKKERERERKKEESMKTRVLVPRSSKCWVGMAVYL
jgi:spore germination cell wall hydrolase CwlJ-like protein